MRIAIVYDCLFPHTVGGAERWCRALADRLSRRHRVTYVTRRQWGAEGPGTSFETVAVSPGGELYAPSGRRKIWPPLRYGWGVFWHLLRRGRSYDAIHCTSFPYFSLLAAALALRLIRARARLIADWHEVWGRNYWISYAGPVAGRIGYLVQRLCVKVPDHSLTFSRLHEMRLVEEGHTAPITRLTGEYAGGAQLEPALGEVSPPRVVFAGRHIPEKRVPAIPDAIARARADLPGLRCVILGDGPDTERTRARVAALGLGQAISMPGRVTGQRVTSELRAASLLLLPSAREGYGLVVVEAVSVGTPAVLVRGPENAATELIEPGVNGLVAESAAPDALAAAIVEVVRGGAALRRSTHDWYLSHAGELSIASSLVEVERAYLPPPSAPKGIAHDVARR